MIGMALFAATFATAGCSDDEAVGPRASTPKIALYSGNGCWAESITAGQRMFEWMGYRCEVVSAQRINTEGLDGFNILYIPGGNMYQYALDISSTGKANIRSFVASGGGYVGICGGAYFASRHIQWQGTQFIVESLQLFEGMAVGPVDQIEPYPGFDMCEVAIVDHAHPITSPAPASEWDLMKRATRWCLKK
jgi:peptidase E